jgi:hypothetical protein
VSDHGGLIVMSKDQDLTNEILFSWDEGNTFETYVFQFPLIISGRKRSRYLIFKQTPIHFPPVLLFMGRMESRKDSCWESILRGSIRGSARDMIILILVSKSFILFFILFFVLFSKNIYV